MREDRPALTTAKAICTYRNSITVVAGARWWARMSRKWPTVPGTPSSRPHVDGARVAVWKNDTGSVVNAKPIQPA